MHATLLDAADAGVGADRWRSSVLVMAMTTAPVDKQHVNHACAGGGEDEEAKEAVE